MNGMRNTLNLVGTVYHKHTLKGRISLGNRFINILFQKLYALYQVHKLSYQDFAFFFQQLVAVCRNSQLLFHHEKI